MWRFVAAATLVSVVTIVAVSTRTPTAYACSAGADFDPVASADVIVEGRVLGYEVLPDEPLPGNTAANDAYVPVRIDIDVARVIKGDVGVGVLSLVDRRTLSPPLGNREDYEWIGSSGACGAFNSDPTGVYAILGLTALHDGTLSPNLLRVFFLGEEPSGQHYDDAVARMRSFPGAAELPALGSGPEAEGGLPAYLIAVAFAGATLLASGAAFAAIQRRRGA